MPQEHADLSVGPPEQMVRLPDLPSGRALWIARDGLRYYVEVEMTDQSWEVRLHSSVTSSIEEIVGDEADIDVWNVITRDQFVQAIFPNGVGPSGIALPAVSGSPANRIQPSTLEQETTSSGTPVTSLSRQQSSSAIGAQGRVDTRHSNTYSNTFQGGMPVAPTGEQIQARRPLQQNPIYQGDTGFSETRPATSQNGTYLGTFGNIITGPAGPSQVGPGYPAAQDRPMGMISAGAGRGPARETSQVVNPHGGYQTRNTSPLGHQNLHQDNSGASHPASAYVHGGTWSGAYGNTVTIPQPSSQYGSINSAGNGQHMRTSNLDAGRNIAREAPQLAHQEGYRGAQAPILSQNLPLQAPAAPLFPDHAAGSDPGEQALRRAPAQPGGRGQPRGRIPMTRGNARGKVIKAPGGGSGRSKGGPGRMSYADFKQQRLEALANGTALQTSPAVQNVLDQEAPLISNGPIPDWQQMGNALRNNFGGRDLRGPLNLGGGTTAGGTNAVASAVGRNAVRDGSRVGTGNGAGNGANADAPDPEEEEEANGDEEDAPGEEVSDDE